MRESLLKELKNIPEKPGIYIFKKDQQILYVGKAKSLKKRVLSYFSKLKKDRAWVMSMIPHINSIETVVTSSEVEALILETNFIKEYRPKYNTKLIDDKNYPFIKFFGNEKLPRFTVVRKINNDSARYFGPFLSSYNAQKLLEILRDVFGIHISSKPLIFNGKKPCFNCLLNNHICPLEKIDSLEEYHERVSKSLEVINGRTSQLIDEVKKKMLLYSKNEQFELAARYRDVFQVLNLVSSNKQVVNSPVLKSYDCLGVAMFQDMASISLHRYLEGKLIKQEIYFFNTPDSTLAEDILQLFIASYYTESFNLNTKIEVITNYKISESTIIKKMIKNHSNSQIFIKKAQDLESINRVNLANLNAETALSLKNIGKDKKLLRLKNLQDLLRLDFLPRRIEFVDISNLATSEAVGAITCFVDGQRFTDHYRKYKIKTVVGQDDFAMIAEIVSRRFNDRKLPTPDLFVVDGDFKQLAYALKSLKTTLIKPKYSIALAKKPDRIFLPTKQKPLVVAKNNPGLLLLSEIRDETHRFAINYQRYRQKKRSLEQ